MATFPSISSKTYEAFTNDYQALVNKMIGQRGPELVKYQPQIQAIFDEHYPLLSGTGVNWKSPRTVSDCKKFQSFIDSMDNLGWRCSMKENDFFTILHEKNKEAAIAAENQAKNKTSCEGFSLDNVSASPVAAASAGGPTVSAVLEDEKVKEEETVYELSELKNRLSLNVSLAISKKMEQYPHQLTLIPPKIVAPVTEEQWAYHIGLNDAKDMARNLAREGLDALNKKRTTNLKLPAHPEGRGELHERS